MDERQRTRDLLIRQVANGWVVGERDVCDGAQFVRGGRGAQFVRGGREYVATSAHALAALVLELTGGLGAKPPEVSGLRIMPCAVGSGLQMGDVLASVNGRASALFGGATPVGDAAG